MYNILVVDDEELIREKIVYILKNNNTQLNVSETENGQEALDAIRNGMVPDILITDIRMPVVNGLDLIKEARELHPEVKFVIISGYAEFDYAIKAVQSGVTDYILKPIKSAELLDIVYKLIYEIDLLKGKKEKEKKADLTIKENKKMVFEKKLFSLLTSPEDELNLNLEDVLNEIKHKFYSVSVIYIRKDSEHETRTDKGTKSRYDDFYDIIQKCTQESKNVWLIENLYRKNSYIIICGDEYESEAEKRITIISDRAFCKLQSTFDLSLTVGVSDVSCNIRSAYKNALVASKRRFLTGINKIFYFNEKTVNEVKTVESLVLRSKLLEKSMENEDLQRTKKLLEGFVDEVFVLRLSEYMKELPFDYIFIESINAILRVGLKYNVDIREIKDPVLIPGNILENMDDIKDVLSFFDSFIDDIICKCMESIHKETDNYDPSAYVLDKVLHFINQNINDVITLNSVSEKFLINPSYLSRIFKDVMGKGFVQYVTDLKMEKARNLLQNSSFDIADIAASLGYSDQQYFNRVFKRSTKLTPNEYRNLGKKSPKI
jgi:Response regulator containing CheY-like receiver domain and AraC-type DNA-binding domain